MSPTRRREAIEQVRHVLLISERRTCRVLGRHRSTQRHPPKDDADEQRLTADIIALAKDYGRYGYRRIHALLGQPSKWIAAIPHLRASGQACRSIPEHGEKATSSAP